MAPGGHQDDREATAVFDWRADRFRDLGFSEAEAFSLAASRADTHTIAGMLSAGCTHSLAVKISV